MQNRKSAITTKIIVYGALFAALAAVLGQLLAFRPVPDMKFTLDKCILFLSGMFFGPVVGGMVGFVADFAGGYLFGQGFTFWLCFPAVFYGVCGGLFQHMLSKKLTIPRLIIAYLVPTVIGAYLVQSVALAYTFNADAFVADLISKLIWRGIQFAIMMFVEVPLIYFLVKSKLFTRAGLWPPVKKS